MSPEERFLVAACRPRLMPEQVEGIAARGSEVLDWDQIREQAVSLGLAPVLFRNLSDARLTKICPPAFLSRLGRASHIAVYLAMHRREELARREVDAHLPGGVRVGTEPTSELTARALEQTDRARSDRGRCRWGRHGDSSKGSRARCSGLGQLPS